MKVAKHTHLGAALALIVAVAACDRSAPRRPVAREADPSKASPRAVVEQLIAARNRSAYQRVAELVISQRAQPTTSLLMAADDFLHANDALCEYVRREFTLGLSQAIDQSRWGRHLGVFSAHVELLDEHVEGDEAAVSFLVDGRLPASRARLKLVDGRWRYDPGAGFDQRIVDAFNEMARGLRQVLADLKEGRLAAADIQADPQTLIEEVRLRLSKGVKLFPAAPATQPSGEAPSP